MIHAPEKKETQMSEVTLSHIKKQFGDVEVIHDISLDIAAGEFCVLVGPSGCGKSTLLRMVAGLETVTDGQISIGGRDVTAVDASDRGVAMVFQTYALYPHMTVEQNMGFGLKMTGTPKAEVREKVTRAAEALKLTPYLHRFPKELSGGQRQRVAIGRAITRGPEVFLFDEPLSNLDAELRVDMRIELARLHQEVDATMIYVTHDQVEAMTLADKIVVLRDGRIEQVGPPVSLYDRPENRFVAQFIGSPKMNFLTDRDILDSAPKTLKDKIDETVEIGIRPEHLRPCPAAQAYLSARLELVEHLGENVLVYLKTDDGSSVVVKMDSPPEAAKGEALFFKTDAKLVHLFNKDTGKRI